MKKLSKVFVLVLSAIMVLAMSASVFAADITVENVKAGETYKAYKIMEFTSDTTKNPPAYSYFINNDADGKGTTLKNLLTEAGFTFKTSADGTKYVLSTAPETADAITTALKGKEADLKTAALAYAEKTAASDKEVVFSNLEPGYWFVTTTTGSLCSLASYDDEELVVDKHDDTTVEKTVTEESTGVGETLHFTATINAKKGETIKFTDTLGNGLKLNETFTVTGVAADKYTKTTWDTTEDASKIVLDFAEVSEDTTITVAYTATVTSAAIELDEVTNTAKVSWGNAQESETSSTGTPLYGFKVKKIDGNTEEALAGVKFTLKNTTATSAGNGKYYDGTTVWTANAFNLTTDSNGMIEVKGIPAGTYELTEVETLDGYNLLDAPVTVTVAKGDTGATITASSGTVSGDTVTVENKTGAVLPTTGGIGTTIFYVLGSLLVVGCGIVLISRRRMENK